MTMHSVVQRALLMTSILGWGVSFIITLLSLQGKLREISLEWFSQQHAMIGALVTLLVIITTITLLSYRHTIDRYAAQWQGARPSAMRIVSICWLGVTLIVTSIAGYTDLLSVKLTQWMTVFLTVVTIPIILGLIPNHTQVLEQLQQQQPWKKRIIALIVLAVISGGLYFYRLGDRDLFEDEFQVVDAAAGYYYTGTFWKWDWVADASGQHTYCPTEPPLCHYTRAWPHSWLIAQVYRVFGISPWSSRLISAVAGIAFVLMMYKVTTYMVKSSSTGVVVAALSALYPQYVNFFRMTRMYALLLPLIVLIIYGLYRGMTEEQQWVDRPWAKPWIGRWFRFHFGYLALAAVAIAAATTLHIIHLVVLPGAVLFALVKYVQTHEQKYGAILIAALLGIGAIALLWQTGMLPDSITHFIGFFTRSHVEYLRFISQYPFKSVVGIGILLSALISSLFIGDTERQQRMTYLTCILGFGLLFYFFIAQRYSSFAYVLPLSIVALVLVGGLFRELWHAPIHHRLLWRAGLSMVLLISMGSTLWAAYPGIFDDTNVYGKFSAVEQTLMEQYTAGEAIIAQYPRRFYLQQLPQDTRIISMKFNQLYTTEQLIADVQQTGKGWIIWEKRKQYHLRPSVLKYIKQHFEHTQGTGIDDTNVEVYYFTSVP